MTEPVARVRLFADGDVATAIAAVRPGTSIDLIATGIADGDLHRGVRYTADGAETGSIVVRSRSGTVRSAHGTHLLHKLR